MQKNKNKKNKEVVVVKTNAVLLQELSVLIEPMVLEWLKNKDVNIFSLVTASMSIVEKYSAENAQLTGKDKLDFCLQLVPLVLQFLKEKQVLSEEKAKEILNFLNDHQALIEQFIGITVAIAQQPWVIQSVEKIKTETGKCKAKCCP